MARSIPLVDMTAAPQAVASGLHRALQEQGFVYIAGHGIPTAVTEPLMAAARHFFAQGLAAKKAFAMENAGAAWRGFFAVGTELTAGIPDRKEGLYFGVEHPDNHPGVQAGWPMHGRNQWPTQELQQVVPEYLRLMTDLGHRLMALVATGLGLEDSYFRESFSDDPTVLFRIFNYPAEPDNHLTWGVGEHTDMGFLTILLQDQLGGLEVQSRDGSWLAAPPLPDTFVINIGDMLQHWTRGIYKATLHRVRNVAGHDRLSCPFFFDPHWQCKLQPIPRERLRREELEAVEKDFFRGRWDGLDLSALSADQTYGDFVWSKIRDVFPWLSGK